MTLTYFNPIRVTSFEGFVDEFNITDEELIDAYEKAEYDEEIVQAYNEQSATDEVSAIAEIPEPDFTELLVIEALPGRNYGLITEILGDRNQLYVSIPPEQSPTRNEWKIKKVIL